MSFERLLKNPRGSVNDTDNWVKTQSISAISRNPVIEDISFFEKTLESNNPIFSLLAHKGLSKLFPLSQNLKKVWKELFLETIDLLEKRANSGSGSAQIRTAAIKALAFSKDLSISTVESVLKSINLAFSYETSFITPEPLIPLLHEPNECYLSESIGLLLASLPIEQESTIKILKQELECQNPDRLIPALISLQLNPSSEMTDLILKHVRNENQLVSNEAIKALSACGNKKVSLVITSLLKNINSTKSLINILPVAASSDKEEIWPLLVKFAKCDNIQVVLKVLRTIDNFYGTSKENKVSLYSEISKRREPEIISLLSLLAWHAGSKKPFKILKQLLESDDDNSRYSAASILSEFNTDKAIMLLLSQFEDENDNNIINQIFISLRHLFVHTKNLEIIENSILPWLNKLLNSSDDFIRNQAAVLCGFLGPISENIVLEALSKESHPYVIASLLSALGKCGYDKLILYSKYHDHNDSRVRANMIYASANCGNEALPYFHEALNDVSPRVRANAAFNLFKQGQLKAINNLNSMLQVPEPLSVLSACYAIQNIFKIVLPRLETDHPLALSMSRMILEQQRDKRIGPGLLNTPEVLEIFNEMASTKGDRKKILWLLEEKHKRRPSSFVITRLLAAMYILSNENSKALPLMEICVRDNPSDLADLLDAYRTVLKLGDLNRANKLGEKTNKLYKMLLDGCIELCKRLKGTGTALMLQRLNFFKEPSMNLYNVMIQLKVTEDDPDTVMYLITELILARPFNINLINKLIVMLPEEYYELKEALEKYSSSISI